MKNAIAKIGAIVVVMVLMSAMYMAGRVQANQSPAPVPYQEITLQEGQTFTSNYIQSARTPDGPVHGYAVNLDQLDAMNMIRGSVSGLQGFRLYFGTEPSGKQTMVVVGVNSMGSDITSNVVSTNPGLSGLCPTLCDAASPLMGE